MNKSNKIFIYVLIYVFSVFYSYSFAQNSVTLRRTFIDSLKNSVSFYGDYIVDKSHKKPNTGKNDGDLHIAGRNKQIGLPVVAEIMNAKDFVEVIDIVHDVEGTNESLKMQGVWRLWFEHPHGNQYQTYIKERFNTTNPDHVFELHPVLNINNVDLVSGLKPISGFTPKIAKIAFEAYANTSCHLSIDNFSIKIDSKKIGYNYVNFKISLISDIETVSDGSIVYADVYSLQNKKIVENVRMVFVKNSEPEKELKNLKEGEKMRVLGIPRVNLNEISKIIEHSNKGNSDDISINLPYEMIIVGVY